MQGTMLPSVWCCLDITLATLLSIDQHCCKMCFNIYSLLRLKVAFACPINFLIVKNMIASMNFCIDYLCIRDISKTVTKIITYILDSFKEYSIIIIDKECCISLY